MLCAQRPLKSEEFIAAVSVHTDGHCSTLSHEILLDMCCNLVDFDTEHDVFRFAHLSVQEYVEDRGDFDELEVNTLAAERCLDNYFEENLSSLTIRYNNIFILYATLYWPVHYRIVEKQCTESLKKKIQSVYDWKRQNRDFVH